jgi:hypothetical protein
MKCTKTVSNPFKENVYQEVFNSEFNLSFHKPKKDNCDICEAFRNFVSSPEYYREKSAAHKMKQNSK